MATSIFVAAVCAAPGVAGQLPTTVSVGVAASNYQPWFDFTGGSERDANLFLPSLLRLLSKTLGVKFVYVPFRNFTPSTLYEAIYGGLLDESFDISWAFLHRGSDPYNHPGVPRGSVVMTCPFFTDSTWLLIAKKTSRVNLFRFLEPFHWQLWFAILGCILLMACLLVVIHKVAPLHKGQNSVSLDYMGGALYHACASFLGSSTFEWLTPSGRVLHIAVLFLVLVTTATYTANLAAFFTKPNFQLSGPKTLDEAKQSTLCLTYSTSAEILQPFARRVIYPPDDMTLEYGPRAAWCRDQLHAGNADAFSELSSLGQPFLLQNCDNMARVESCEFNPSMSAFVMKSDKLELQRALTNAILALQASPDYQNLLRAVLSMGSSCEDNDSDEVTLEQMKGFFLLFGLIALFSALVAVLEAARRRLRRSSGQDSMGGVHEGMTDAEMILQLSKKMDVLLNEVPALVAAQGHSVSI